MDTVQLIIIIFGWLAAFYFGVRQQRIATKEKSKLKVYEEIWKQRSVLQNSANQLLAQIQLGPPFVTMESALILGSVTKEQQHIWQGQQEALSYLNNYLNNLLSAQTEFNNQFMEFWRSLEMRLHVMPGLEVAMKTLTSEYAVAQENVSIYIDYALGLNRSQWAGWDREAIQKLSLIGWQDLYDVGAYTEDMMGLVHNELVTPVFRYAKRSRKPTDRRFKVLTKDGLVAIGDL